jgi:hypothetical protein
MKRHPFIIEYTPPNHFESKFFTTEYSHIPNDGFLRFRTLKPIETDIIRKTFKDGMDKQEVWVYNMNRKYYLKAKEVIPNEQLLNVWKITKEALDIYQLELTLDNPEFTIYQSTWTQVLHPYTKEVLNIPSHMIPRVYSADGATTNTRVDLEAVIDMILFTPYLFYTYSKGIQNHSKSFFKYSRKFIPFHEAILDGSTRPNAYFNTDENIGWRQHYNKKTKKFITFCYNKTLDKFISNMREIINILHQNNIVYLDWNIQNIGYSELDKRFKLFDFDCIHYVSNKKIVGTPKCKPYKHFINTLQYEHTSRSDRSAFEIDWLLFYTMVQELNKI